MIFILCVKKVGAHVNRHHTFRLTAASLFIAIIIIQSFVPWLGYLPLGPTNVTIVHVTVIVASLLFDAKGGALLGAVWGGTAMIRNLVQPNVMSPVFANPLVAFPGRILTGLIIGWLSSKFYSKKWHAFAYGALGAIINTVITMSMAYFFAKEAILSSMNISSGGLLTLIITIMVSNGVIEAIISALLTGLITPALKKIVGNRLTE